MVQLVVSFVGVLLVAAVAVSALFVLGMRTKSRFVQSPIIWLGKHQFNKVALRSAGEPGAGASIIRHLGRTSGTTYETPIAAVATDDGFLIALPYGLRSNWLRNVLAAGQATLVHEGETFELESPEMIPLSTVETAFAPKEQRMHSIFNVTQVLRLRRVDTHETSVAA